MAGKKFFIYCGMALLVFSGSGDAAAQLFADADFSNREYVIGIGDSLSFVELSTGRTQPLSVRPDGRITIQLIGELQAAGLKIPILQYEIEKQFLRMIKDPAVTVSLISSTATTIQIMLRETVSRRLDVPKGITFGQALSQVMSKLQQAQVPVNFEAIQLIGEVKSYKFTEQSWAKLKELGMTDDIAAKLKPLLNREYTTVKQFLDDVEQQLGAQTPLYRISIVQQAEAVRERLVVNGVNVSQGRDPAADIKLAWGDEIIIPPLKPTPTAPAKATPKPPAGQFPITRQEYEELQNFLKEHPDDQRLLQAFLDEADKGYFQPDNIPWEQLSADVRSRLEQLAPKFAPPAPPLDLKLVGINVNLAAPGLLEALVAFPEPDSEGKFMIKSFRKDDILKKGETKDSDLKLDDIQPEANQIILKKGSDPQPVPVALPPKLIDLTFSGIVETNGVKQAILSKSPAKTAESPIQRKRFKEGDTIEADIKLTKITEQWVLLKKGGELQLVLLRDAQKRATPTPSPAPTPLAAPKEQTPGKAPVPPGQLPSAALKKNLPKPLQAIDTFTRLFFATPTF